MSQEMSPPLLPLPDQLGTCLMQTSSSPPNACTYGSRMLLRGADQIQILEEVRGDTKKMLSAFLILHL